MGVRMRALALRRGGAGTRSRQLPGQGDGCVHSFPGAFCCAMFSTFTSLNQRDVSLGCSQSKQAVGWTHSQAGHLVCAGGPGLFLLPGGGPRLPGEGEGPSYPDPRESTRGLWERPPEAPH